jgi:hypothetical protein
MMPSAGRAFAKTTKALDTLLSDATCNENKLCMGRWLHAMKCMVVDDQDVSVSETQESEAGDGLVESTHTDMFKKMQEYRAFSRGISPFPVQVFGEKNVYDTDSKMRGEFCFAVSCYHKEFRNSVTSAVLNVANLFKRTACQWLENCYHQKTNVIKYVNRNVNSADSQFDEFTIHVGFFPEYVAVVTVCVTRTLFNMDYDGTQMSQHLADIQAETFKYEASQRSRLECLLQTPQTCLPHKENLAASHRQMASCTFHQKDMDSVLRMFDFDRRNVIGRLWDDGRFNPSGMKANRLRSCMADGSGMVICTRCGRFMCHSR